jgi:L-alanine-DL-glutamate epimerase-like enolase superfamily enzyme
MAPVKKIAENLLLENIMKYLELEDKIRIKAKSIEAGENSWTAADVSQLLTEIADNLAAIRTSRKGGIDATMKLRTGDGLDI